MKKNMLGMVLSASLLVLSVGAEALTVNYTVDAKSNPWDITNNPSYGVAGSTGSTIANDAGFDFSPGSLFTITYTGGTITVGGSLGSSIDGNGVDTNGKYGDNTAGHSGNFFPSLQINESVFLGALVGTFADALGNIVGGPFKVGNGSLSLLAPSGASQLQFGINDDLFGDNSGFFTLDVEQSAVPVPAAVWLFGSALVGLAGMRKKKSA